MSVQVLGEPTVHTSQPIEYPESDGQPMGETEIHVMVLLHLYGSLRTYFRHDDDVYVAADMFLYYEEGNVHARKAPDVMVVKGVEKELRRTFKVWEEGATPSVIIEVMSKSTWREDLVTKSGLYGSLGVDEYFIYDPLQEFMDESFQGFRLRGREYVPIDPNEDGSLTSLELGLRLAPQSGYLLRVIDPQTGEPILDAEEAMVRADMEAERAEREAARADAAIARAEQSEQRIAELLALLSKDDDAPSNVQ